MEQMLSNNWFVTVMGGALASLVAALIVAIISNFRPSVLSLYWKALTRICEDFVVSPGDKRILQRALKTPDVEEAIKTRASNPGEEAELLCKAVSFLAPPSSRLTDPFYTASLVGQLLDNEFKLEGSEKYQIFHDRNRDRHLYFDRPQAPLDLTITATSQQITLTWNVPSHSFIGTTICRYHIARSTNPNGPFTEEVGIVQVGDGNPLSFTDKGLMNGTTYYYVVTAESKVLKRGIPSEPISAVPMSAMPSSSTLPDATAPLTLANSKLSSTPVVSSTFFMPREHLQDVADKCVGRKQELDKLRVDFAITKRRLILIKGFGGLGKTTLASRFAIDVSLHYNLLWMDCSGIRPTGELFFREMGKFASDHCNYPFLNITVEDPKSSPEEKEKALLEFLVWVGASSGDVSRRPVAFFFDDYHLVEDLILKQLVVKIAESHVNVKVVLIIRYLPPELQHLIDPLSGIQLEGLSFGDCRKLVEMYTTSYPALRNLDDEKLQRIWKLTGQGVPTALRIFISMTRRLPAEDVLDELPSLTAATREKWLDKLFCEFSLDEQQVATEVSIFRRPTLRRVLIYVSQCVRVKEVIEALVDRFVLTFDGKQYSMHALWLDYTRQHLSSEDAKVLHRKAADFYHNFQSSDRRAEVMSRLESCYHYIQAEDMEQAEKELISIAATLRSWGFFQEFTEILIEIEKDAQAKNRLLAPHLILEKSSVMYAHGDVEQAITCFSELASKSSGEIKIKSLLELGWIYTETGNRRQAERLLEQSRELAHQCSQPDLEEEALYKLQEIAFHQSEFKKALDYDQQRLIILGHMENDSKVKEAVASTYHDIGNIYRERGFYEEALEYYQRYLPFWQDLGNPYNRTGWLTYNIGEVYRDLGKLREAMDQFEYALQIFNKMQYIYGIAHVKIELGRVGVKLGPSDVAIQYVQEALDIFRRIRGKSGEAYALGALGEMYLYLSKLDWALQYLQDSLLLVTSLGNTKGMAWSLYQISLVHEQQGKSSLLSGNYIAEAYSHFCKAAKTIAQAQELFAQIDAAPNIYGIQDDAVRIQRSCAENV